MIDIQGAAAIAFLIALTIFVYYRRDSLETKQVIPNILYFSMYRTKLGLRFMDIVSKKYRKLMIYIGYLGVLIGFLGMAIICYGLVNNIYMLFTKPAATPGVGLVLPFKAKGVFYVPFFYWIISIFVIAIVHEFSHGLIARAHNIKVKSSGFAFLGGGFRLAGLLIFLLSIYSKIENNDLSFHIADLINSSSTNFWLLVGIALFVLSYVRNISQIAYIPIIPAAFVEPNEKELKKRSHKEQLSVFAAGPFSNIAIAFLFVGIASFILAPLVDASIEANGVKITDYVKGKDNTKFPAELNGINIGETIQQVDGKQTPYIENLSNILRNKKPDESVSIKTDKSSYQIKLAKNPENESLAYMGAYLEQSTKIKDNIKSSYGQLIPNSLIWLYGLFVILVILNFGIGLFNLVPIGPLDGGRMMQLALHKVFDKEKGDKYWFYIGVFFLALILVNIVAGFVK